MNEFVPQRTAAYISQHDVHIGEMTVRETLAFSARCQGVGSRYGLLLFSPLFLLNYKIQIASMVGFLFSMSIKVIACFKMQTCYQSWPEEKNQQILSQIPILTFSWRLEKLNREFYFKTFLQSGVFLTILILMFNFYHAELFPWICLIFLLFYDLCHFSK